MVTDNTFFFWGIIARLGSNSGKGALLWKGGLHPAGAGRWDLWVGVHIVWETLRNKGGKL